MSPTEPAAAPRCDVRDGDRAGRHHPPPWQILRRWVWPDEHGADLVRTAQERLLLVFSMTAGLCGIATSIVSSRQGFADTVVYASGLVGLLLLFLVPACFHLTRNYRGCAWLLLACYAIPAATALSLTGGLLAGGVMWLFFVPVLGGLLLGLRPALALGAALILLYLAFYFGRDLLGPPVHGMDPARMNDDAITVLVVLTAGVSVMLGSFHRVVERTNRRLKEARDAAEAANEAKSRFLANMSHELRTPLNGLLGFADLLAVRPLDPEAREYLQHIRGAGSDLLALVNDVLDYNRVETGAVRLEIVPFDLHALLEQLRQRALPRAAAKGLAVRAELAPDLPCAVRGDPLRLRQVLGNLLDNAVKFTDRGTVTLTAELLARMDQTVELRFSVADTGAGIPPEALPTLFDRFTQADNSTTRRYGGSGLGLAIVRSLVALMDGQVSVASTPGAGSTFRATVVLQAADPADLPALRHRAAAPPAAAAAAAAAGAVPARILVAEDNAANQRLFGTLLSAAGYRVEVVADGQAALDALRQSRFDLVLMDGQMPVLDGLETARRIRAAGSSWSSVPILALTADALAGDRNAYLEAGMDDYLTKPVDLRELLGKVESWIGRQRS
ncbi:ATP-binding protein [Marinibaculum pumilum]|uniref:histidine kinase n=1 Tax=Marinibaculum pumilum TaxID=1766165 RepID=A0ABV7L8U6_9PROT